MCVKKYRLTERELQVLELLKQGKSNREIAKTLLICLSTSKAHVRSILYKLGVSNRVQAVAKAIVEELILK